MTFAEEDDVVSTFSADTPVEPLDVRVLPGTVVRRHHLFDAHILDALSKPSSIDVVTISEQVSRRGVPWKCLDNLLSGPFGCGIRRYVEVNDLAPGVTQDDKQEQQPKSNSGHDKKVDAHHIRHVILDEGSPGLRRRFPFVSAQQSRHGPLGDYNAKFEQFTVNLGAPQVGFESAILMIIALTSGSTGGRPRLPAWDFRCQ